MRSSKQGIKSTRFSLKDGIYKGKTKGLDFYKHYFVEYPSSLGEKQLQIVRWGGGAQDWISRIASCQMSAYFAEERNVP